MNLKRLIVNFVCIFTFIFILNVNVYAAKGVVTGDVVNVRKGASLDSEVITKVYSGNTFEIISLGEDWTHIEYKFGESGYIYNDFFKPAEDYKICIVNGQNVNIRAGAGVDAKILGIASKGNTYRVKNAEDGWVEIEFSGQSAYICSDFVTVKEITASEDTDSADESEHKDSAPDIMAEAVKYLGCPYVYGASGPNAFDCSGFTKYVYSSFGISLPRVAADQAGAGTHVSKNELKEGDLVFFSNGGYIDHVGIYAGNGKMIHAGSSSASICYADLDTPYFASRYAGARRIF